MRVHVNDVMRSDEQQCRTVTSARVCACFEWYTLDRRESRARTSMLAGASWRRTGLDSHVHEGRAPRCAVGRPLEEVPVCRGLSPGPFLCAESAASSKRGTRSRRRSRSMKRVSRGGWRMRANIPGSGSRLRWPLRASGMPNCRWEGRRRPWVPVRGRRVRGAGTFAQRWLPR